MRLASRDRIPRPTLVTTGTGSGKTESFLVPVLDHCRRHAGRPGIKALILYPMNALANDQARRLAGLIHEHRDQLGDITAGLYTGDSDRAAGMTGTSVIGDKHAMRRTPPDILLTNYKMLDMLLLRSEDTSLFAGAGESLRYLVLDEFHTYDGAQGTDVAMLLRRLGLALGVTTDERPLGAIVPVATSATLGGGAEGGPALREFAQTVFGTEFDEASLIGEDRLMIEEWAAAPRGRTPLLDEVTAALSDCTSHEAQLAEGKRLFLGDAGLGDEALAEPLRAHPLTRTLLRLTATPCSLTDLAQDVEPSWAATTEERRVAARHAVALYLALLSRARIADGRPLLGVDVQLWVREVSRLLRSLSSSARFRWHDGAGVDDETKALPSVYCRHCGRSGWGVTARAGGALDTNPTSVWAKTATDPVTSRTWIFAPGEAAQGAVEVRWVDTDTVDYATQTATWHGDRVPVLVTPDAQAARDGQCPSCGLKDGIRYLGSRVATLASVTLGQLFGSPDITAAEKKTLVFTDSVQDASHRAAFVESRAYALNMRALLHRALGDDGCTLETLGTAVTSSAHTAAERYAMLPPDLKEHEVFRGYWNTGPPEARVRRAVAKRMSFTATLEFELSSRTGRTLELTGAVTAHVHVEDLPGVVASALVAVQRLDTQLALDGVGPRQTLAWARGVLERIRIRGGIDHPWLRRFAASDNRHSIWGGRPRRDGMPAFPKGRPAPAFPTTARHAEHLDVITGPRNWYATWTARALGVPTVDAYRYVRALLDALVTDGALTTGAATGGNTVWQIPAERVHLARTSGAPPMLRCTVCVTLFPGPELVLHQLAGAPCQRDRCLGGYAEVQTEHDYYRELYRGGEVRRILAREHTSLLAAKERVELENSFKSSTRPDAPNVLTCTPTLELGIDIGDLSMVALTSLPRTTASYLKRVGRAGRLTGSTGQACRGSSGAAHRTGRMPAGSDRPNHVPSWTSPDRGQGRSPGSGTTPPAAPAPAARRRHRAQTADYLHLLTTRAEDMYGRGRVLDHQHTIATLWSVSLDQLRVRQPAAVQLLRLCAYLAPEPIPLDVFTNRSSRLPAPLDHVAGDPLALAEAVGALVDYFLVDRTESGLLLHRLVQGVVRQSGFDQPDGLCPLPVVFGLLDVVERDVVLVILLVLAKSFNSAAAGGGGFEAVRLQGHAHSQALT